MQCIKAVEVSLLCNITKRIDHNYIFNSLQIATQYCLLVTLHTAYNKSTTVEIALYTDWYTHKSNCCVC